MSNPRECLASESCSALNQPSTTAWSPDWKFAAAKVDPARRSLAVDKPERESSDLRMLDLLESLDCCKPHSFLVHFHQLEQGLDIQWKAPSCEYPQKGKLFFGVPGRE